MSKPEGIKFRCPSCGEGDLKMKSILYSIPYFNELAMFTMECPKCNFHHNDVFSAEQRAPSRWTLKVNDSTLLYARVVRSGSGTIRLPEFGIDVEPGPTAESFITNVEGLLQRTRDVVVTAINFAESKEQREKGQEVLDMMDRAIAGNFDFTLIMEDPAGVSGIIPEDLTLVEYKELTTEEASTLKGAPFWLDVVREEYQEHKG
jgi:zinc finger protein